MDALNSGKLQEDKCSRRSRKEQGERSLDFQVNQERPRWEGGSGVRGEGSGNVSYIDTQERDLQVMGSASGKTLRWVYAWIVCEQEGVCVGVEWVRKESWERRTWDGHLEEGLWLCRSCLARGPVARTVAPPSEARVTGSFEWKMTWPEFSEKGNSVCQAW